MSPPGFERSRVAYPVPGAVVAAPTTRLAPISTSLANVVVTAPVSLVVLVPWAAPVTSTGWSGSIPPYCATRTSGDAGGTENVTVTALPPGVPARIPGA